MARWRAKALELLPEFSVTIQGVETPYMLWIELGHEFQDAYEGVPNDDLIRRFYMFADWCWRQRPQKELDLNNCVAVCFYEHLVDHRAVRDDIPRWLSREKFDALAGLFEWRLDHEDFASLNKYYDANASRYEQNFEMTLRRSHRKRARTNE
ncbi:MAG TPA: hypothetical protein VMQ73_04350 [Methylomirabilota bacterium]|nr:hypothetical protein [Methylomirabilota bacterium]